MNSFENQFIQASTNQNDAYAKALANFMFREIVEVAHTKYNISQEDMALMCKNAVDRAALFLSIKDTELYKAFVVYGIVGLEWDSANPDTEFAHSFLETLKSLLPTE